MWLTINIIILMIGACLFGYALYIDSSENTAALLFGIFGVIVIACSGVSGLLLWIFG